MNIYEIINGVKLDITSLSFGEKIVGGVFLAIVSMLIVFAILACISAIISLMYKIFYSKTSSKEELGIEKKIERENKKHVVEVNEHKTSEALKNQNELVSVITACINQFRENEDRDIIVKKIVRSNNNYSSWNHGIGGINNDKKL